MTLNRTRLVVVAAAAVLGAAAGPAIGAADAHPAARHFANCTAMHKTYKHGVGKVGARDHVSGHTRPVTTFKRSNALYTANKGSDRDHDGIACEKL